MRPRSPSAPDWFNRLLWVGGIIAGAWLLVLMGTSCVKAGSDGWPVPRGQASTGVESSAAGLPARRGNAAVAWYARQAQPVPNPRNRLRVINDTGHTLVLDVCCEGYPYGQPQVVPHGECAVWVWRRGETTVSDGTRIWGPRLHAIRAQDGAVVVRIVGQ